MAFLLSTILREVVSICNWNTGFQHQLQTEATTHLNIWLAKALTTRFRKCERLLAACKKERAVVWIIIALKSKSAVGQSGISKVSISKLRNFTDHWSAPLSSYNINTTGVAQDLLEEHVKKGFLKGGKIQISRECFIIIYLFWGTLIFVHFSILHIMQMYLLTGWKVSFSIS